MSNQNRILSRLVKKQQPNPRQRVAVPVVAHRNVKRRVIKKVQPTRAQRRRPAVADVPCDTTLPTLQARTRIPLEIAFALRALFPLQSFIEAGTYCGNTANVMAPYFAEVVTIENEPNAYTVAREQLAGHPNVTCLFDAVRQAFPDVLQSTHQPAMFWLDTGDELDTLHMLRQIADPYAILIGEGAATAAYDRQAVRRAFLGSELLAFAIRDVLVAFLKMPRTVAWFNTLKGSKLGRDIQPF